MIQPKGTGPAPAANTSEETPSGRDGEFQYPVTAPGRGAHRQIEADSEVAS